MISGRRFSATASPGNGAGRTHGDIRRANSVGASAGAFFDYDDRLGDTDGPAATISSAKTPTEVKTKQYC